MSKLIVILGITGNQGNSVAQRFLQDSTYRIRGITRNTTSETAKALAAQGIELVQADLDDPAALASAFAGANLIFTVTNYWEPFFRPDCRALAAEQKITPRRFAYDVEYRQGVNIADAAAKTVDSLDENGFVASTLSAARARSGGKMQEVYHFDAKSDVFPGYVNEKHPKLAAKMSCVQTGCFMTSFRLAGEAYFGKQSDGTFQTTMPMAPTKCIPHLDVNADMGPFVYAVSKMPAGKSYMAAGTSCTWPEYDKLWTEVTGVQCNYNQISLETFVDASADREAGIEIGAMFVYSDEPGYDGGDGDLLWAEDLRKAGVECPMTSLEEFMRRTDWSEVLKQ